MAGQAHDRGGAGGGGAFATLDPKLTIYALANGMDLIKDATSRRLEWFRDGHDRGILLRADGSGGVAVTAMAWRRGDDASVRTQEQGPARPGEALAAGLSAVLQQALDAANAL